VRKVSEILVDPIVLVSLVFGAARSMIPLLLGSVGEVTLEKSGLVNMGVEGIMLLSAFASAYGSWITGNPFIGLVYGVVVGALSGLLYGYLSVKLRADQVVMGLGITTFSLGLTEVLTVAVWTTYGYGKSVTRMPPLLNIVFGNLAYQVSYFLPLSIALALGAYYLLYKTKYGLIIRSCGENALAADAAGIDVPMVRYLTSIFAGILFGLAGTYIAIDWNNIFTRGMTGGRGWVSIALVIFSGWNPLAAVGGSLIFGFFDTLQYWVSASLGASLLPAQLPRMIPYLVTVIALAIYGKRGRGPADAGKPYVKE
jgi:ABC-type uncharacterized transport system permease subunit